MTVAVQTPFNSYTANGVTTVFAFAFAVLQSSDLVVQTVDSAGNATTKTLGADYTVSGVGAGSGGTVTFLSAPANGLTVKVFRSSLLARSTDYQNNGDLLAAILNVDLDRVWLALQEILGGNQVAPNAIRAQPGESLDVLAPAASRKDHLLGFNISTGQPEMSSFTMTQVASVVAAVYAATAGPLDALSFLQGGTGARSRTAQNKAREIVSLEDFGALGDGVSVALNVRYASLAAAQVDFPFVVLSDYNTRKMDWAASRAACIYCAASGATLRMSAKNYVGARIEVHGTFNVEGNGATVEYLGFGNTLIAGTGSGGAAVPTAWPATDTDAMADRYPVTMFTPSAGSAAGTNTMTFSSVTGLAVGNYLFIAENPTSLSSATNFIPKDFEYVRIKGIVGNVVTFYGKLRNTYTTAGRAFQSNGVAVNCSISGLRINTTTDSYQFVGRSGINVSLEDIGFAGESAIGAVTFIEGFSLSKWRCTGAFSAVSTARGTVSATIERGEYTPRTVTPLAEDTAVFIEESCYRVTVRNLQLRGGAIRIGSMDMVGCQGKRLISLEGNVVDARYAPNGVTGPIQIGLATGVDINIDGNSLLGTCVVPDVVAFPGGIPSSLIWISGIATADTVKITRNTFASTNAGTAIGTGSSTQGKVIVGNDNSYETCTPPGGSALTLAGVYTATGAGFSAPTYRVEGRWVHLTGAVNTNAAADASTITTLPTGARPSGIKAFACAGYSGAANQQMVNVQVATTGAVTLVERKGATTVTLDNVRFSLDF